MTVHQIKGSRSTVLFFNTKKLISVAGVVLKDGMYTNVFILRVFILFYEGIIDLGRYRVIMQNQCNCGPRDYRDSLFYY